jgi:hypothetical protein
LYFLTIKRRRIQNPNSDVNRYDAHVIVEHFLSVDAFEDENLSLKSESFVKTLRKM